MTRRSKRPAQRQGLEPRAAIYADQRAYERARGQQSLSSSRADQAAGYVARGLALQAAATSARDFDRAMRSDQIGHLPV
jgi:hypothetical protein